MLFEMNRRPMLELPYVMRCDLNLARGQILDADDVGLLRLCPRPAFGS